MKMTKLKYKFKQTISILLCFAWEKRTKNTTIKKGFSIEHKRVDIFIEITHFYVNTYEKMIICVLIFMKNSSGI